MASGYGKWGISTKNRPTATGVIDETSHVVHTGHVVFPDDRKYNFWYYPQEATIYWDNDKGKTNNIWKGKGWLGIQQMFQIMSIARSFFKIVYAFIYAKKRIEEKKGVKLED